MNKIAIATLSFTAGALVGFLVGHFVVIEKDEEESRVYGDDIKNSQKDLITQIREDIKNIDPAELESPKDDDPEELVSKGPARIARPGQPGVNYSKVQQIVKENGYTDPEDIQEVIDDPDNEETYEERVEREEIEASQAMSEYRKKNKDKIVPIQSDEWNTDFPEVDYDKKDLHYFTEDGILCDDDGNKITDREYEFLGPKPRQFGWMENDEPVIYIRNNPMETDFQVWKHRETYEDWWQ